VSHGTTKPAKQAVRKATDEIDDLLHRAQNGDRSVLPWLRDLLKDGEMTDLLGGLVRQVRDAVVDGLCGENLAVREGIIKKMAEMRTDLAGPDPTPLERQLAERIVLCWLTLYECELRFARARDLTIKQADYWQRRIDSGHKRYLSAIKTLATVRKLAVPVLIGQLNIAAKQVNKVACPPAANGPGAELTKSDTLPQSGAVG
jgi:hypothetical protein